MECNVLAFWLSVPKFTDREGESEPLFRQSSFHRQNVFISMLVKHLTRPNYKENKTALLKQDTKCS